MTRPRLSLCMIVRDESRWLAGCLDSVRALVDEMIVVDTGSTDDTIAIAQSYGAKIVPAAWEDDFSKARNISLEHATGDWILVLDADERIGRRDHAAVRDLIEHPRNDLYSLVQTSYSDSSVTFSIPNTLTDPEAQGYSGYFESPLTRVFRRDPAIRFHGVIHEHATHADPSRLPAISTIRIHHLGKYVAGAAKARKDDLYLRLGERKCELRPNDPHAWYELGVQYWELERRADARRALEHAEALDPNYVRPHIALAGVAAKERRLSDAMRHHLRVLELDPANIMPYLYLPAVLVEAENFPLAEKVIALGFQHVGNHPSFHINRGVLQQAMGNYRRALECFDIALEQNPREGLAHLNKGISWLELGEFATAYACFEKAATFEATRVNAWKRMAEWHFRRREFAQALTFLEQARAVDARDDELLYQMAIVQIQDGNLSAARHALDQMQSWDQLDATGLERLEQCWRAVGNTTRATAVHECLVAKS